MLVGMLGPWHEIGFWCLVAAWREICTHLICNLQVHMHRIALICTYFDTCCILGLVCTYALAWKVSSTYVCMLYSIISHKSKRIFDQAPADHEQLDDRAFWASPLFMAFITATNRSCFCCPKWQRACAIGALRRQATPITSTTWHWLLTWST